MSGFLHLAENRMAFGFLGLALGTTLGKILHYNYYRGQKRQIALDGKAALDEFSYLESVKVGKFLRKAVNGVLNCLEPQRLP